jgi:phosphate transport system substrate-binding protein
MKLSFNRMIGAVAGLALAGLATSAVAADITGAGATFPYPIYSKWATAYKSASGVGLNYQSIGSGGGIAQIKAKTVTFGASDMPLSGKELEATGLAQFPTVVGGIVPIVNVSGVGAGQLFLDGPTLAKIFLGQISNWSDPAIKALNSGVTLPNQAIVVVHRSDGSGTTFGFANYLGKVSPDWDEKVGAATSVEWPVGIGAKGNEGVASNVAQTSGAIGYVELAYAKQNKLAYTGMLNKSGAKVQPTLKAFEAAASNADWSSTPGFGVIITDQPGAESWPIASAPFVQVYKKPVDPKATGEALKFFSWAYKNGDKMAEALDYVPLPDSVTALIEASWSQIQAQ